MGDHRPAKAELILDAALRVLAEEGYRGITIAKVADEAGVSRGLLHYYFESKEDMLIQLMHRSSQETQDIVSDLTARTSSPGDFAELASEALRAFARNQRAARLLMVEVMAVARTNPRIRKEFAQIYENSREGWIDAFDRWEAGDLISVSLPRQGLATIIKALVYGVGLTVDAVPSVADEEETWAAVRETLLRLVS